MYYQTYWFPLGNVKILVLMATVQCVPFSLCVLSRDPGETYLRLWALMGEDRLKKGGMA